MCYVPDVSPSQSSPHVNPEAEAPPRHNSPETTADSDRLWLSQPTLTGTLVTLRPLDAKDIAILAAIMTTDRDVVELTGSVHSADEVATLPPLAELVEIYTEWSASPDRIVLGVEDNHTGTLVGEVVLKDRDPGNRSASFRGLIGAEGRGRGLGTEAVKLIVDYGLTELGLHRISLEVYAFNPRAIRVYEKVGFVHEGTGKDALWFDGQWVEVHYMAILNDTTER